MSGDTLKTHWMTWRWKIKNSMTTLNVQQSATHQIKVHVRGSVATSSNNIPRGVAAPLFLCYTYRIYNSKQMDRERLKLIVKNLKSLVTALESEVYSDVDAYKSDVGNPNFGFYQGGDDDDGYAD